jgi:hypothetical protein
MRAGAYRRERHLHFVCDQTLDDHGRRREILPLDHPLRLNHAQAFARSEPEATVTGPRRRRLTPAHEVGLCKSVLQVQKDRADRFQFAVCAAAEGDLIHADHAAQGAQPEPPPAIVQDLTDGVVVKTLGGGDGADPASSHAGQSASLRARPDRPVRLSQQGKDRRADQPFVPTEALDALFVQPAQPVAHGPEPEIPLRVRRDASNVIT